MSILIITVISLLLSSVAPWCWFGCSPEDVGGVKDQMRITVDHATNATVLVKVINDLADNHTAHFTDVKIGIGILLAIVMAVLGLMAARKIYKCYTGRREEYVNRRAQSIIRRFGPTAQAATTAC